MKAAFETAEADAWTIASGASTSIPVPVAPAVPTVFTVAVSSVVPVPMLILRPGAKLMFAPVTPATLMFVAPTADAALSDVAIGGMYGPPPEEKANLVRPFRSIAGEPRERLWMCGA